MKDYKMLEYSINLRKLIDNYIEPNSLGDRPAAKDAALNNTQTQMEEIYEKLRRFALNFYTPDQLKKAYPKHDHYTSIRKVQDEVLKQYLPSPERIFDVQKSK